MNVISTYFKKINKNYTMIQELSEVSDDRILGYGEVIVYNDGTNPEKCKVGDGNSKFKDLSWLTDVSGVTAKANNMLNGVVAVNAEGKEIIGTVLFKEPKTTEINLGLKSTGQITLNAKDNAAAIKNGTTITARSDIDKIYKEYSRSYSQGDPYESWYSWNEIPWSTISSENGGFSVTLRDNRTIAFYGGTRPILIRLHIIVAKTASSIPSSVYPVDSYNCVTLPIDIAYDPMCDTCYALNTLHTIRNTIQGTWETDSGNNSYSATANVSYSFDDRDNPSYRAGYYVFVDSIYSTWRGPYYNPYETGTYNSALISDFTSDKIRFKVEVVKLA